MCLGGTMVASWSLTLQVAEWQGFELFYRNDKYLGKSPINCTGNPFRL